MNEIERLYENVGIERTAHCVLCDNPCPDDCYTGYLFTAEKQVQLENFLLEDLEDKTFTQFEILKTIENKFLYVYRFSKNDSNLKRFDTVGETRQECLAGLINNLWQSLTEEERKQVKEILQ